jgi:hypothetical protein
VSERGRGSFFRGYSDEPSAQEPQAYLEPNRNRMQETRRGGVSIGAENRQTDVETAYLQPNSQSMQKPIGGYHYSRRKPTNHGKNWLKG